MGDEERNEALEDVRTGCDQCATATAEASVLAMGGNPEAAEIEQWLSEAEGALSFARERFDEWCAGVGGDTQ